ncbi:hypothetical protein GGF46_001397 [Coemansia sp. RSA 552]|nr:hypothetical protein GGF46_001397 [Coemansia sp. RSA 552]
MVVSNTVAQRVPAVSAREVRRPTYIGIHTLDEDMDILYISSGCMEALGFTPEFIMDQGGVEYVADSFDKKEYMKVYQSLDRTDGGEEDDDEANALVIHLHLEAANGRPLLQRMTAFKCDNCVVVVGMSFPEVSFQDRTTLEVERLGSAMEQMGVSDKGALRERGHRSPFVARSRQVKAVFVVECAPEVNQATGDLNERAEGPLIVFVTGSVSRLIDADTSDMSSYPFLKLVAPEDVLHVSKFFDRLSISTDVMFETFSLLHRPHVIDGDVVIADQDNPRVVVECLGAATQDGVVILLRKLRVVPAPKRDTMGNYVRPRYAALDEDDAGYVTLSEFISSDPETSDAPDWAHHL